MTTVTIPGTLVEVTVEQLIGALKQLPTEDRQKVREVLDLAWQEKFRAMMDRVSARYEANPLSDEEIEAEIEAVRQERYDSRRP